ncbi:MAG: YmdB family metallophosphoesterase, partial [Chloroflexia bacterium]|nr:YmdB family metallophosphoesterase [Chloroflexia bacterium]
MAGASLRLLFVGDIVGPDAVAFLADRLPGLRQSLGLDLVVANAENASLSGREVERGFGMSRHAVETLFTRGVDLVTSGNHAWDQPDAAEVLAHPRVLRPFNLPPGRAGLGIATLEVGGEPVTVVNLADRD